MPETAMHKNDLFETGEHEVRSAREIAAMQAEAIAKCMSHTPDQNLGFCIFAPNLGH
jgi:hypothetical protein